MKDKSWKNILVNKKIFIIIVICITFFISMYNTKNIVLKVREQEIKESIELYNGIEKKLNFLSMLSYEIRNNDVFKEYFSDEITEGDKKYNRIRLNEYLKKINTIYGELGVTIEVLTDNEGLVFSNAGTMSKKDYFNSNILLQTLKSQNRKIVQNEEKLIIFLSPNKYERNKDLYWIITLRKDIFFVEINSQLNNWYITDGNDILNLGNLGNINKEKLKKYVREYKAYFIDENFMYYPENINILEIFSYELVKGVVVLSIFYIVYYLIRYFIIVPIQSLANKIGYSGKNIKQEVKFIEQKMEDITLENKYLESAIKDMKIYQTSKKIKDYLLGLEGLKSLQDMKVPIINIKKYRVIILEIFDIEVVENIYDKIEVSKEFIKKYFEEDINCEVVWLDYKSIGIILEDNLEEEELENILLCLCNHCERNFKLTFTVAITQQYLEVGEMPKAYKEAKKILEYKYAFKEKRVIFFKDIYAQNKEDYYYPIELEAKLITRILNSNEIGVKKVLNEIFDETNISNINKKQIKELGRLLYNTLNRIFIQINKLNKDLEAQNFNIENILQANDLKELEKGFEEKIYELYKINKLRDMSDILEVKQKIEGYIKENYQIDISLENLADYLGHSFRYTSILFKKVMNDNFKNYLNIYRIEKAKELIIENKEIKVKDLAEKIGYNSSNTFIRIFRKYEGVSPGKYLEKINEEEK